MAISRQSRPGASASRLKPSSSASRDHTRREAPLERLARRLEVRGEGVPALPEPEVVEPHAPALLRPAKLARVLVLDPKTHVLEHGKRVREVHRPPEVEELEAERARNRRRAAGGGPSRGGYAAARRLAPRPAVRAAASPRRPAGKAPRQARCPAGPQRDRTGRDTPSRTPARSGCGAKTPPAPRTARRASGRAPRAIVRPQSRLPLPRQWPWPPPRLAWGTPPPS